MFVFFLFELFSTFLTVCVCIWEMIHRQNTGPSHRLTWTGSRFRFFKGSFYHHVILLFSLLLFDWFWSTLHQIGLNVEPELTWVWRPGVGCTWIDTYYVVAASSGTVFWTRIVGAAVGHLHLLIYCVFVGGVRVHLVSFLATPLAAVLVVTSNPKGK